MWECRCMANTTSTDFELEIQDTLAALKLATRAGEVQARTSRLLELDCQRVQARDAEEEGY